MAHKLLNRHTDKKTNFSHVALGVETSGGQRRLGIHHVAISPSNYCTHDLKNEKKIITGVPYRQVLTNKKLPFLNQNLSIDKRLNNTHTTLDIGCRVTSKDLM